MVAPSAVQLTAHLYERREVELSFQSAALAGDKAEAMYWLLELCESGWVDGAWDQLWLAYYDFYSAHSPHFEGELMDLSDMKRKNGSRSRYPLLHGASALIGRRRSAGAWLLRQAAIGASTHPPSSTSSDPSTPDPDPETTVDQLLAGPVEAARALAAAGLGHPAATWQHATPIYEALVARAGGEPGGARGAWGRAGPAPLPILCALLLHLGAFWADIEETSLDLSPPAADRNMVAAAAALVRRSRVTPARDRLLLWRQHKIRPNIGCFGLPQSQLPPGGLGDFLRHHWLRGTAGCQPWDRVIARCKGERSPDGTVTWPDEEAENEFHYRYGPDVDELPGSAVAIGTPPLPRCTKLRWLTKLWPVKPVPDLWKALMQEG